MRNIYVLRHGQTDYNVEKRLQGILDTPLNQVGLEQAYEISASIKNLNIDTIISSPLSRAFDTAKIIQSEIKLSSEILVLDFLKEITRGLYDGILSSELEVLNPKLLSNLKEDFDIKPPSGESLADVYIRISSNFDKILADKSWSNLLIVTHGITIRAINLYFESNFSKEIPKDLEAFYNLEINNCSIFNFKI